MNKFVLQADPPAIDKLPEEDILGVTVVLVTCSYKDREFVRIGYYVNNEYTGTEHLPEATEAPPVPPPPLPPIKSLNMQLVQRQILAHKPRVTKFAIPWGEDTVANELQQPVNGPTEEDIQRQEQQQQESSIPMSPSSKAAANENGEEDDEMDEEDEDDTEQDIQLSADDDNVASGTAVLQQERATGSMEITAE